MKFGLINSIIAASAARDGISYVVVGDFGNMNNLAPANAVFDAIAKLKQEAVPESPEDFQFFVTVGDNLYPKNATTPTDDEFKLIMDLFGSRESIKDLPIYPTRGNHDCYFSDMFKEVELSNQYPTWQMPNLWYEKQVQVGPNGEKLAMLMVDSCLLICDYYLRANHEGKQRLRSSLDDDTKKVLDDECELVGDYQKYA